MVGWHNYKKEGYKKWFGIKGIVIFWEFVGLLDMGAGSDEVTVHYRLFGHKYKQAE